MNNKDTARLIAEYIHDPTTWNAFARTNKTAYFVAVDMKDEKYAEFYSIIMHRLCEDLRYSKIRKIKKIDKMENLRKLYSIGRKAYNLKTIDWWLGGWFNN